MLDTVHSFKGQQLLQRCHCYTLNEYLPLYYYYYYYYYLLTEQSSPWYYLLTEQSFP